MFDDDVKSRDDEQAAFFGLGLFGCLGRRRCRGVFLARKTGVELKAKDAVAVVPIESFEMPRTGTQPTTQRW